MNKKIIFILLGAGLVAGVADYASGTRQQHTGVVLGHEGGGTRVAFGTEVQGGLTTLITPEQYTLIVTTPVGTAKVQTDQRSYYLTHQGDSIVYTERQGGLSGVPWEITYYR